MQASGTFTVADFTPTPVPGQQVQTAIPLGIATMDKRFEGDVSGRATTLFTSAFDESTGAGTYVAMESFDGTVHDRAGAFNFAHSKTTLGDSPQDEFFVIVPGSGTKDLAGITGTGGIRVDADGTHHIWFDYELNR
ncbi:uncharacterized protein DUF3224 [Stackebrandtia endophytica]|uniref:Uncharacterized protein DUF3224 n=1 Tax=Stackebrandtia endophytica TaxID=1496996 RepID=A0A543AVS5_9ACTN|nr:DUF3224 domain-containing protein [Stackebrandtia endophytica]TQL76670.1 uncharacterized protein DUF3224 [Stackebrandtia endophytica]